MIDWARFQVVRRTAPGPFLVPLAGATRIMVDGGDHPSLVVYAGLFDYEEMLFTTHLLRPGDLFVDVGANVGVYSLLASGVAGARSIAFEPVAATLARLRENVVLNGIGDRVDIRAVAAGGAGGVVRMRSDLGAQNRLLHPGEHGPRYPEVEIVRLDDSLPAAPMLMKIDVEGFELAVLEGAGTLLDASQLVGVIIELAGHGREFGFSDDQVRTTLSARGFQEYRYDPRRRLLAPASGRDRRSSQNALFLRSIEIVAQRVRTAPPTWIPHVGVSI